MRLKPERQDLALNVSTVVAKLACRSVAPSKGNIGAWPLAMTAEGRRDILVNMTRKASSLAIPIAQPARNRWRLQDAKARFSELVRMAHNNGPQLVTLHGRDAVVVVDAGEFNRLQGARNGELLIEALQASPHRQIEIEPSRNAMPVRAVKL